MSNCASRCADALQWDSHGNDLHNLQHEQALMVSRTELPAHLGESNVVRVYAEALAAHVESVLADQAVLVGAHAAVASALAVLLGVRVYQSLGTHGC